MDRLSRAAASSRTRPLIWPSHETPRGRTVPSAEVSAGGPPRLPVTTARRGWRRIGSHQRAERGRAVALRSVFSPVFPSVLNFSSRRWVEPIGGRPICAAVKFKGHLQFACTVRVKVGQGLPLVGVPRSLGLRHAWPEGPRPRSGYVLRGRGSSRPSPISSVPRWGYGQPVARGAVTSHSFKGQ